MNQVEAYSRLAGVYDEIVVDSCHDDWAAFLHEVRLTPRRKAERESEDDRGEVAKPRSIPARARSGAQKKTPGVASRR